MLRKPFFICLLILLTISISNGTVPQLINYQGWLTDDKGKAIDGMVSIQFTIYDQETNGIAKWSETQSVTITDGVFSVLLGSVTPVPFSIFDGSDRYLALKVGNDSEMTPRKHLVSVGYTYRAYDSDKLDGIEASSFVQTIEGISPGNNGNIILEAGGNITIEPDSNNNKIKISTLASSGDNLGNHTATENIKLGGWWLSGDGEDEGLIIKDNGYIGINNSAPGVALDVNGRINANSGIYGKNSGGNNGYLGGDDYGAFGIHPTGNNGFLGSENFGAYGAHNNGNYGYLGGMYSSVYGEGAVGIIAISTVGPAIIAKNTGSSDIYQGQNTSNGIVFRVQNDGTTVTKVLEITGGGDLAEPFDISDTEDIESGLVVAIDPEHPGQLCIANKAYDHTVAGIISGANGIIPGLTMSQEGTAANGSFPVALTGRVYAWADASNGSIEPGDLLTTSERPGHAMKVTDYEKAHGAVLGKAMSSLSEGQGLVLVLVTLH